MPWRVYVLDGGAAPGRTKGREWKINLNVSTETAEERLQLGTDRFRGKEVPAN
jgi:hypothetical protein